MVDQQEVEYDLPSANFQWHHLIDHVIIRLPFGLLL